MRSLVLAGFLVASGALAQEVPDAPHVVKADAPPLQMLEGAIVIEAGTAYLMPAGVFVPDAQWEKLTAAPPSPAVAIAVAFVVGAVAATAAVLYVKR